MDSSLSGGSQWWTEISLLQFCQNVVKVMGSVAEKSCGQTVNVGHYHKFASSH